MIYVGTLVDRIGSLVRLPSSKTNVTWISVEARLKLERA